MKRDYGVVVGKERKKKKEKDVFLCYA